MSYTADQLDQIVLLFEACYYGSTCFYCGNKLLSKSMAKKMGCKMNQRTQDHLVPKTYGGAGSLNLVACCYRCNHTKGSMSIDEFRDYLNIGEFFFEQDLRQRFHAGTLPWKGATFPSTGIPRRPLALEDALTPSNGSDASEGL